MTVEVESQSWFGRIGNSIKGVLFGVILGIVGVILLFWNEGNYVKTEAAIHEVEDTYKPGDPSVVNPEHEGKPVHMVGQADSSETLADKQFQLSVDNAIKLSRSVEMFQWKETKRTKKKKKVGGGTERVTTYEYEQVWHEGRLNSDSFKNKNHANPSLPLSSKRVEAKRVSFGAFQLSSKQVGKMGSGEVFPTNAEMVNKMPENLKPRASVQGDFIYITAAGEGGSMSAPQIGDTRVRFRVLYPSEISILTMQKGNSFTPYVAKSGRKFGELRMGNVSAPEIIQEQRNANTMMTWLLRFGGFILITIGINMFLSPLTVLADVIPFVGNLVGAGVFFVSLLVSGGVSIVIIGVAWFYYRPVFAIILFVVAALFIGLIWFLVRRAKGNKTPATPDDRFGPPNPPSPGGTIPEDGAFHGL